MHDYVAPFREVAGHFGLQLWAPSEGAGARYVVVVLDGWFEGVPVHVYRATSSDARYSYVWVSARRSVVGDLGLSIALLEPAQSFFAKLFGSDLIRVEEDGHKDGFDDKFAVRAAEPARARAFLRPELRAELLAWHRALRADAARHDSLLWGIWADDERVYLELQPEAWKWKLFNRAIAIDELTNALRAVASLSRSFDAAMGATPPSPVLAPFADAWRGFAEARGLSMSTSPLCAWGRLGDGDAIIRAVTTSKGKHSVEVRRVFAMPMNFFVRVKPGRRRDFYTWDPEGPHERMDDPDFDDAFSVITTDRAAARAWLTAPVRAALLELHRRGEDVLIDSTGVAVEHDGLAADELERAIAGVDTVAHALAGSVK